MVKMKLKMEKCPVKNLFFFAEIGTRMKSTKDSLVAQNLSSVNTYIAYHM